MTSAQTCWPEQARDALARRDDLAGDLEPGNGRGARRRRIAAVPLEHVGPVDPGERDLDQHLARRRAAARAAVSGAQHLGSARLGDPDRRSSFAGIPAICAPPVPHVATCPQP